MLAGRYPSDEFAELRPRLVWDRVADTLTGRRGAQRLAVTSGGTIPDRGLFGVFLATGEGPGRRVGELDEEMVYESRVGDVFTLGTSTWRIEDITHDRVLVTPAPGLPGRLPFWKGDSLGRPAELGRAVGAFVREVAGLSARTPPASGVMAAGLDAWAADNLLAYLAEQREATGHVPDDRTIVVERFRDELGDWRVAVHSPVRRARSTRRGRWRSSARMRERFGVDVQAMHGDDGIVLRLPDLELARTPGPAAPASAPSSSSSSRSTPTRSTTSSPREIGGSALFAARFRECAARALLLPRRRPDRRQPLWQQRQRAAQLLEVASQYPTFPIVLEAVRECVQDVFDVPGLAELMRDVAARDGCASSRSRAASPRPFARSLLFGYVAQFLYEGDSPLAERRAAALSLDPALLAELLGTRRGARAARPARRRADRPHRGRAAAARPRAGLPRRRGRRRPAPRPRPAADRGRRGPVRRRGERHRQVGGWLVDLEAARRVIRVRRRRRRSAGPPIEDAARLRDALGCSLPVGVPQAFLDPVADPLGDLVARYARTHGPFRRRRRGRALRARRGRRPRRARPARRRRPGRRGRVAPRPAVGRHRVLRRRGAAAAAPPLARRAARRGRAGRRRATWRGSCPAWQGVGAGPARPRGAAARRRAADRRRPAGERAGDPRAPEPGRRLHPGAARRAHGDRRGALVRARRRCPATTAGSRSTSPDTRR